MTDGSLAQAGEVGEYLSNAVTGDLSVSPGNITSVGVLSVPPGAWLIQTFGTFHFDITYVDVEISPIPAGASGNGRILLDFNNEAGPGIHAFELPSAYMQLNISQPTLISYAVNVGVTATSTNSAGQSGHATYNFATTALRIR